MYLHLGTDCMVKISEIIGIFNVQQTGGYREYLAKYPQQCPLINIAAAEKVSSLVVTDRAVYLSAIAAVTLKKRVQKGFFDQAAYIRRGNGGKDV